jgi:hypothetical protein
MANGLLLLYHIFLNKSTFREKDLSFFAAYDVEKKGLGLYIYNNEEKKVELS